MRRAQARVFLLAIALLCGALTPVASASTLQLVVAEDKTTGYNRSLFKHWIDADKDSCNTRAEVLIEEAVVKPKIGPRCKLTGGKWLSSYDGKTITNASQLDVDHLVPLAEAWRSGAWKWTAEQRQAFANDLDNSEALIAVTLSTNRSKGDKDPSSWMPKETQCNYVESWISIKSKYVLSVDEKEKIALTQLIRDCSLAEVQFRGDSGEAALTLPQPQVTLLGRASTLQDALRVSVDEIQKMQTESFDYYLVIAGTPVASFSNCSSQGTVYRPVTLNRSSDKELEQFFSKTLRVKGPQLLIPLLATPINFNCAFLTGSGPFKTLILVRDKSKKIVFQSEITTFTLKAENSSSTPAPTPTQTAETLVITPGAFCSPPGAIGKSSSGVTYTCKTSATDTRNRWRQ
jgi:hypothetical protein